MSLVILYFLFLEDQYFVSIIIESEGENCYFKLILNPLPTFKKISFRNALLFTVLNSNFTFQLIFKI